MLKVPSEGKGLVQRTKNILFLSRRICLLCGFDEELCNYLFIQELLSDALHRRPGVVKSGQGLLGRRPEMTRHIDAWMWCQMSKGSHTRVGKKK